MFGKTSFSPFKRKQKYELKVEIQICDRVKVMFVCHLLFFNRFLIHPFKLNLCPLFLVSSGTLEVYSIKKKFNIQALVNMPQKFIEEKL